VVVVGQTPPPFGGQAVMIQALLDGDYSSFELVHVRMDFSHHVDEIGAFRVRKLGHLALTIARIAAARMRHRATTLYYPPAGPNLVPICRDIAILLATRWMFRAVIFHFHASGVSEAYPRLPAALRPLYRLAYRNPDAAVRLSELTPDDPGALGAAKVHVVPNGVPDNDGASAPPARPNAVPTILYVGVLTESKGLLVLLEACAILKKHGVVFNLDVVGGPQPAAFAGVLTETIEAHGLEQQVRLCGVLDGEEKWRGYREAAVFAFPTFFDSEAFPVVLLEAMQFGLPVVATEWRGIPSIVDDGRTGFLVPPHDAGALAERIEALLERPDLAAEFGRRARERYLSHFTMEAFQRNMEAVIASIASPR
jgi:glycosyltransferase involved in cell wall biosynthesis